MEWNTSLIRNLKHDSLLTFSTVPSLLVEKYGSIKNIGVNEKGGEGTTKKVEAECEMSLSKKRAKEMGHRGFHLDNKLNLWVKIMLRYPSHIEG